MKGPCSHEDLRTVDGECLNSYREAALKRGLLLADNYIQLCLQEATAYQMPAALRRLFAMILVYCNPINARSLWQQFEKDMCEDYTRLSNINYVSGHKNALHNIANQLESIGKDINDSF